MIDVMIDLETLATEHNAIVASLGAVLMDMDELKVLDATFYTIFNWDEQHDKGRIAHPNTFRWWLGQSDEARKALLTAPDANTGETNEAKLYRFASWCGNVDGAWGNGADFDCSLVQSLYRTYGIKSPFSFRKHRCFRTLKNLSAVPPLLERVGTHHHALDDAVFQAHHLMEILKVNRIR